MNAIPANTDQLTVYTVASYRHMHAVRLFQAQLRLLPGVRVLDWTWAAAPLGLPVNERRQWMNVGKSCAMAEFCEVSCGQADLMVYLGDSGKDTAVQIGMAKAIGTPILGIAGPLEEPGLMLHSAVAEWVPGPFEAIGRIKRMARCRLHGEADQDCRSCRAERSCTMATNSI